MFNCSLLSKICLNIYRPSSPISSIPGTSWKLLSGAPAVPQRHPSSTPVSPGLQRSPPVSLGLQWSPPVSTGLYQSPPVSPGDSWWPPVTPGDSCLKMMQMKKRGLSDQNQGEIPFFQKNWNGILRPAINEWRPKKESKRGIVCLPQTVAMRPPRGLIYLEEIIPVIMDFY